MYSRPVADSIERVLAVWIAAHETISGNTSPTTSRSQTNSAHGPTSAENGPPPVAPGRADAEPDPGHEQHDLERDDPQQPPRHEHERRLGQARRHQVPVARGSSRRTRRRSRPRADPSWIASGDRAERAPAPRQRGRAG